MQTFSGERRTGTCKRGVHDRKSTPVCLPEVLGELGHQVCLFLLHILQYCIVGVADFYTCRVKVERR